MDKRKNIPTFIAAPVNEIFGNPNAPNKIFQPSTGNKLTKPDELKKVKTANGFWKK